MSITLLAMPLLPGVAEISSGGPRDVGCSSGADVGWGNGSPHLKNSYKREGDTLSDYTPQCKKGRCTGQGQQHLVW